MRTSQWIVLGVAFFLLGMLFVNISLQWMGSCSMDYQYPDYNPESIACIRQQIFAPFPYIFFSLVIVCMICAFLESRGAEKEKRFRINLLKKLMNE